MSARAGAADTNNKNMRLGVIRILFSCVLAGLAACTGGFETDPLVEYSTDLVVNGSDPARITRYLGPGTYLIEIRERDIDLRVGIDAGATRSELADAYLRHGLHRTVVRLDSPARLTMTLRSVDVRSWKGAAAIRILR
jgi:hypothetical protein